MPPLTDAHDLRVVQTVSADNHPIHYDVEYAPDTGISCSLWCMGCKFFTLHCSWHTLFPVIGDEFLAIYHRVV